MDRTEIVLTAVATWILVSGPAAVLIGKTLKNLDRSASGERHATYPDLLDTELRELSSSDR